MPSKDWKMRSLCFITFAVVVFVLRVNVFAQATPANGIDRILDDSSGVVLDTSQNPVIPQESEDKTGSRNWLIPVLVIIGAMLGPIIQSLLACVLAFLRSIIMRYKDTAVNNAISEHKNQQYDESLKHLTSKIEKINEKINVINTEIGKLKILVKLFEEPLDLQSIEKNLRTLVEEREKLTRIIEDFKQFVEQEVERITEENEEKMTKKKKRNKRA